MPTGVVVPAYNAVHSLDAVVKSLCAFSVDEIAYIVIVNDGSSDGTGTIAEQWAQRDVRVHARHHLVNRGYGATLKSGLAQLTQHGCDCVVCIHADGQYTPQLSMILVQQLRERELDLLQGSRLASGTAMSGGMPAYKYCAGRALVLLENAVLGCGLSDYHSGLLVYGARVLQQLDFESLSDSFDFDIEVIASVQARRLKIGEYPIPTRYADEVSYLRPVAYGLRVLCVVAKYAAGCYNAKESRLGAKRFSRRNINASNH